MKIKKLLAGIMLCFVMLFSFSAISAFAAEEEITFTDINNVSTVYQKSTDEGGNITLYFKNEDTSTNYATAEYAIGGKTVLFKGSTLRSVNNLMRAYWEVGKKTTGGDYNTEMLPADKTGDLTWTIYGTVEQGEYTGNGALVLPKLSGGYIYKDGIYSWKTITINAGAENAVIVSNSNFDVGHSYIDSGLESTSFTGITFDDGIYATPRESGTMSFNDCTFTGQLRVPSGGSKNFSVTNCTFNGEKGTKDTNGYVFHYQAEGTLNFSGNTVAADKYKRGLNIDNKALIATVDNNVIGSAADEGRSLIQVSSIVKINIINNTLTLDGDNAFTLHSALLNCTDKPEINIDKNKISGSGYLIYDDAAASNKSFTVDNLALNLSADNTIADTIDRTQGKKGDSVYTLDKNGYVYTAVSKSSDPEILKKSLYVTYTELGKYDFGSGETDSIKLTLLAGIDSLDYDSVGFDITVGEETQTFPITVVYTSVKTILDRKETVIDASEFGNGVSYIFGQTINFPATDAFKDASAKWIPYAIKKNNEKITGETFTLNDIFPGVLEETK